LQGTKFFSHWDLARQGVYPGFCAGGLIKDGVFFSKKEKKNRIISVTCKLK